MIIYRHDARCIRAYVFFGVVFVRQRRAVSLDKPDYARFDRLYLRVIDFARIVRPGHGNFFRRNFPCSARRRHRVILIRHKHCACRIGPCFRLVVLRNVNRDGTSIRFEDTCRCVRSRINGIDDVRRLGIYESNALRIVICIYSVAPTRNHNASFRYVERCGQVARQSIVGSARTG